MKKYIWLILIGLVIFFRSIEEDFAFALGVTTGHLLIGLGCAFVWWLFTKNNLSAKWQWFSWLNTASYWVAFIFILYLIVPGLVRNPVWSSDPIAQTIDDKNPWEIVDAEFEKSDGQVRCAEGYSFNGRNCEPDWSGFRIESPPPVIDRGFFGGCKSGYVDHPINPDKCVLPALAEKYYRSRR